MAVRVRRGPAAAAFERGRRRALRSAVPGRFGGRRRRWPWLVFGGAALLFGLLTFQAYRIAYHTAADLRSAADVLRVGPQFLLGTDPNSAAYYDRVRTSIDRAVERVENANWSFDVVGAIPFLGRPVHAAERLVGAAAIELGTIEAARTTLADLTGADGSPPLMHDGAVDLAALDRAGRTIDRVLDDLEQVDELVRGVRPIPFVPETERLRDQALEEIEAVRTKAAEIRRGLSQLPAFFGAEGPRLYLLAILNPAELHGVGGAFLSYGVLTAEDGRLGLVGSGDPLELDPRSIPPTGVPAPPGSWFLEELYTVRLVNAFSGPDFAEGARLASEIVRARFGRPLDGVIGIDSVGLSYLLPSLGPIVYPEIQVFLTAENFVRFSTNAQYRLYAYEVRQAIQRVTIERVWLGIGSPLDAFGLIAGLSRGLEERRTMVWSAHEAEQKVFDAFDWAGVLRGGAGDYLRVTHQNLGVDKLDYYLREHIHHQVHVQPSGDLEVTSVVTMRNAAPPGLLPPVGNSLQSQMRTMVAPLVPPGAMLESVTVENPSRGDPRVRRVEAADGYGKRLFPVVVAIEPKSEVRVRFIYRVPAAVVDGTTGRRYVLTVQEQPLVRPASVTVEVRLPEGQVFEAAPAGWVVEGPEATYEATLDRDLRLSLPLP